MYIYLDESSDPMHYVLTAVGSHSPDIFKGIVGKFRQEVRNSGLSDKDKSKINNDPKEQMLHRYYDRLLSKYVDLIAFDQNKRQKNTPRTNVHMYGAYYKKVGIEIASFVEDRMLSVYEVLFMKILKEFVRFTNGENIEIIFDHFTKAEVMKERLNIIIPQIYPKLSYTLDYAAGGEKGQHMGLFVADIVAGTSRRFVGKEVLTYFHRFKGMFIGDLVEVTV